MLKLDYLKTLLFLLSIIGVVSIVYLGGIKMEKIVPLTNFIMTSATVIMAIATALMAYFIYLQRNLLHEQTRANQLSAIREIFFRHHTREMRQLRTTMFDELPNFFNTHKHFDVGKDDERELLRKTEDILNYYEHLGSLLRYKLLGTEFLDMVHNSAIRIWSIIEPNLDKIREPEKRAADYASDFKYLVEKCKEYRKSQVYREKITTYGTGGRA